MRRFLSLAIVVCAFSFAVQAQTTITLRPTGDGSVKQWNNNSGAACASNTCYTQVDETTGSTDCTVAALVKGDGVLNKAPATNAKVEQYSMTLSSLPTGAVIDSITVHACEARGGGTNTSGQLRIVLNGATTTCGSNQAVTSTFQDLSCSFASLEVGYLSGTTTLEIGNSTTAAVAISMDTIEAQLTYHVANLSGVAAGFTSSPAVTKLRSASSGLAASEHTSPAVTGICSGNCGSSVNHNAPAAAAFKTDPPCCAITDTPLAASVHFGANASTANVITRNVAGAFHTSPAVAAQRNTSVAAAGSFNTDPPCCAITDSPLAASFHTSPVVTTQRQASGNASVGTGLSIGSGLQAKAQLSLHQGAAAGFKTDPPCCASVTSHFSAGFTTSPAVAASKHSNQSGTVTSAFQTAPVCKACVGHFFQSAHWTTLTNVTASVSHVGAPAAGFTTSPTVGIQRGLNKPIAQGFHTSPAPGELSAHFAAVGQGFTTALGASASGPGAHAVSAGASFNTAQAAIENAITSNGANQSENTQAIATGNVGLHQSPAAGFQTVATATAFGRTPGSQRFVVVVN